MIAVVYAIGFILLPDLLLSNYGIQSSPTVIFGFRCFAVGLLEYGLVNWFVRYSHDSTAIRGLLLGGVVGHAVGLGVFLWAMLAGMMNAMGWSAVLIYLIILLGFAYFLAVGSREPAAG